jgi:hypothetical protein
MHNPDFLPPTGYVPRLCLSVRGRASAAEFARASGSNRVVARLPVHADLRLVWAETEGLEPSDAPYLVELTFRPLTLAQLGEALAIHGQTREMINMAVDRLVLGGFLTVEGRYRRAIARES